MAPAVASLATAEGRGERDDGRKLSPPYRLAVETEWTYGGGEGRKGRNEEETAPLNDKAGGVKTHFHEEVTRRVNLT